MLDPNSAKTVIIILYPPRLGQLDARGEQTLDCLALTVRSIVAARMRITRNYTRAFHVR